MTFYDWADELDALETAFESDGHDFYVVYRRSRASASGLDPEGEGRTLR
ncbi:hypothetical protein [Halarchaeum sp. P4]